MNIYFRNRIWISALCMAVLSFLFNSASAQIGLLTQKNGTQAYDRLGWSVSGAGDVNGDGKPDYIVGVPYASPSGVSAAGTALVFSGSNGSVLFQKHGTVTNDRLGTFVAGAGDVNGDGRADYMIGSRTLVFVYSGVNGSLLHQKNGGGPIAGIGDITGDGKSDFIAVAFGQSYVYSGINGNTIYQKSGGSAVAGIGDINSDGIPDFLVGDETVDPNGLTNAGSVTVYSGSNGTVLYQKNGTLDFDLFGCSVAGVGDVNGDGRPDFIIGARLADNGGIINSGAAFVYSGLNGSILFQKLGSEVGQQIGRTVAGAGDVNGDGKPDFLIGSIDADPEGKVSAGSAYLYSGATGTLLYRVDGLAEYDNLGYGLDGLGDLNGDGKNEFIVGAPLADPAGVLDAGSAYIYGNTGSGSPCDNDLIPPVLTCVSDKRISCTDPVVFDTPAATDNCTLTPTIQVVSTTQSPGPGLGEVTHKRTWTATDEAGNVSAPCSQNIVAFCDKTKLDLSQLCAISATCDGYSSNAAEDLNEICFPTRNGKISKISPTAFYYYVTVTAPSNSFDVSILQQIDNQYYPFFEVARKGITVYDENCSDVGSGKSNAPGQADISINGATPGTRYIIAVKYSTFSLSGTYVGTNPPPAHYDFITLLNGSEYSRDLNGLKLYPCPNSSSGKGQTATLIDSDVPMVYPNPFNATTTIQFALTEYGRVKLDIYNILGEKVTCLIDGSMGAGEQNVVWDGTNLHGQRVASGIYFFKLQADGVVSVNRMMLLK